MQPHRQSLHTLILSRTSFKNDAFTAYAATPAIIKNVDFNKDILQKLCVYGVTYLFWNTMLTEHNSVANTIRHRMDIEACCSIFFEHVIFGQSVVAEEA